MKVNKKMLFICCLCLFSLIMTSCQRVIDREPNSVSSNHKDNSLETTSVDINQDTWLLPLLAQYLKDDCVVDDSPSGSNTLAISFGSSSVNEAAGTIPVTVSHNGSTCEPVLVNLSSDDTSELSVPATVTIPVNTSQTSFNATIVNDPFVDGNQVVNVTATANSFNQISSSIIVVDDDVASASTQVGWFSGHLSVITSDASTTDHIYVSILSVGGVDNLLIDDQQGNSLQVFGSNVSLAGAGSAAIIPLSLVDKLSIDTKPVVGINDLVVMRDSLTLNEGLDIKTKNASFFPVSGQKSITTSTGDIDVYALEKIVLDNTFLLSSSGDIVLHANVNDQNTVDLSDDVCSNFSGAFKGVATNAAIIRSNSGSIRLSGCGGTSGNYNFGVNIANATTVKSTTGEILIHGFGGQATGLENSGVQIYKSLVLSDGTAPINIVGYGGSGTQENFGVHFFADNLSLGGSYGSSGVYALNGDITINGTGSNSATDKSNVGVRLQGVSEIKSTGTAKIDLRGTGGNGTCPFTNPDPTQNPCSYNGVDVLYDAQVISTGSGSIYVEGRAGRANGREHHGILLDTVDIVTNPGQSAKILSTNADITLNGFGGEDPTNSFVAGAGIYLIHGGSVEVQNNANITMNGFGGKGITEGNGIWLEGDFSGQNSGLKSKISSVNGHIDMTGIANTIGGVQNHGVSILNGEISTSGVGNISISGTGGAGIQEQRGVLMSARSVVTTNSGNIQVMGIAGSSNGPASTGVTVANQSELTSGTGSIAVDGTGGIGNNDNFGVSIENTISGLGLSKIQTGSGAINITGKGGGNGSGAGNIGVVVGTTNPNTAGASGHGQVISGSGTLTVNGEGGSGSSSNLGVMVAGSAGTISSGGSVTVSGTAGTGSFNRAVFFNNGGTVIQNGVSGTEPSGSTGTVTF